MSSISNKNMYSTPNCSNHPVLNLTSLIRNLGKILIKNTNFQQRKQELKTNCDFLFFYFSFLNHLKAPRFYFLFYRIICFYVIHFFLCILSFYIVFIIFFFIFTVWTMCRKWPLDYAIHLPLSIVYCLEVVCGTYQQQ